MRRPVLRDTRLAWIIWAVFAAAICVDVSLKPTGIVLRDGSAWTLVARSADGLLITRTGGGGTGRSLERRTVVPSEIEAEFPFAGDRSVTPEYRRAALGWWASRPIYTQGIHGFLYLPQAAIGFTPFALMPAWLGECLWRILAIAVYACGVFALSRAAARGLRGAVFPTLFTLASVLSIPAAIGSASNGQTNVILGGLVALAGAALAERRWWGASLILSIALGLKPLAVVPILLSAAVYPRTAWRLGVAVAALAAVPFVHPDPSYVLAQYPAAWEKMRHAAAPEAGEYQDLVGLAYTLGITLNDRFWTAIRFVFAGLTLGGVWLSRRRLGGELGALYLVALAAVYLMLFNPRTEGLTYAVLGPSAAIFGACALISRRWLSATFLVSLCLVLQFSRALTGGRNVWLRPACTIVLGAYLVGRIARTNAEDAEPCSGSASPR